MFQTFFLAPGLWCNLPLDAAPLWVAKRLGFFRLGL